MPDQLLLGSLQDPVYRLRRAIPLAVRREGDQYVLLWTETEIFGDGPDLTSAIVDFRRTLIELYRSLHEPNVEYSDLLIRLRGLLSEYVRAER